MVLWHVLSHAHPLRNRQVINIILVRNPAPYRPGIIMLQGWISLFWVIPYYSRPCSILLSPLKNSYTTLQSVDLTSCDRLHLACSAEGTAIHSLHDQTLSGWPSLADVTQGIHLVNPHRISVGLTSIDKQMPNAEYSGRSETQHVP